MKNIVSGIFCRVILTLSLTYETELIIIIVNPGIFALSVLKYPSDERTFFYKAKEQNYENTG